MPDELTEAMHGEFTVDAATEQRHKVLLSRASVALGLLTPAGAAEAYGVPLAKVLAPEPLA